MTSYGTSAPAYLRRANARLAEGSQESLFYAAFELRCGIETRLQDYLDAQDGISKQKKEGWRIMNAGKELERVFNLGDKIIEVTIFDKESEQSRFALYYTPVSERLRKNGARLGEISHAMKVEREDDDPWWKETRLFLYQISDDLALSIRGTLLGPIMERPEGGFRGWFYIGDRCPIGKEIEAFAKVGLQFGMNISYYDSLPDHA